MIVGRYFDGDDDMDTAWDQHGVYYEALRLIAEGCNSQLNFAMQLLEIQGPQRWGRDLRFDHRTLQHAHDLLAAAWRFRTDSVQPCLPFDGQEATGAERMEAWLSWLRAEVSTWQWKPRLIQLVMQILAEQNREPGYRAEDELHSLLRRRFPDVPWCASLANTKRG